MRPLLDAVADYYRIARPDLTGRGRRRDVVRARLVAMYLARQLTRQSYAAIGRVLGRDHSTVVHGCARVTALRRDDAGIDADIRELLRALQTAAAGQTSVKP